MRIPLQPDFPRARRLPRSTPALQPAPRHRLLLLLAFAAAGAAVGFGLRGS